MPAAGAVGVAIDGVPLFPNYNNRGQYTWTSCEVDECNAHSGKGNDYHYHGDPFGPSCLYNTSSYAGEHPPIIGFSLDGFSLYGRYTAADSQTGVSIALDSCGGHEHPIDGASTYHYHSAVETELSSNLDGTTGGPYSYTAFKLAPAECFAGDINAISNFWNSANRQANYERHKGASATNWVSQQNDADQLRPCCGASHYFESAGMSIDGTGATAATSPPPEASPPPASTSAPPRAPPSPGPSPSPSSSPSSPADGTGGASSSGIGGGRMDTAIILCVAGGVIALVLLGVVGFCCLRSNSQATPRFAAAGPVTVGGVGPTSAPSKDERPTAELVKSDQAIGAENI
jgi:hypothetical protein